MIAGLVKPTLAIDFDGVLNTYASGYQADYVPDPPVAGALEALEAYAEVFQIVIFSTRAAAPEGIPTIIDWINRNGFSQIPVTITAEKPNALVYLDDRGWQFAGPGKFPSSTELLAFEPWWDEKQPEEFPAIDASTAARAVKSLAARAGAADHPISDAVTRAVEFVGGRLDGLDDRMKASPALAGKLAAVMAEKDFTLEQAAADIKDSLRFSAVFGADRYAAAAAAVLALLEESSGLELTRLRNYWLPEQGGSRYAEGTYVGINAVLAAPNGFQFELQFHTPQSLDVQAVNWDLYRIIRSGGLDPAERERIAAQMRENNSFVADPPRVASLAPVVAAGALRADGEGEVPAGAHYRQAANYDRSCGTCSFYGAGTVMRCGMFDTLVSPEMVCDEWAEGLPGALPGQWQWDALDEVTPPLVSAAPGVTALSTMVAVKPRLEEAEAIAAPGGDPPENLHVTLAYIGEIEGDLAPIADALRLVAATHAPLDGVVGGYGAFEPPGVGILLPDVRGLVELRTAVCEALIAADIEYGRSHGFEAHMTVVDPDADPIDGYPESTAGAPLHFDELCIVRGDSEIVAIPFTGALPVTASALVAAGEPFCLPAELRGRTDPIRQAFVKAVMTPALEQAGLTWDITNPLAADVISRAGSHVVGIAQTTQDDLMNVINVAHSEGLSIPDTAKAIRSHMTEASNVRATMIARCLPGETLVDAAVVQAVTRRWYEGDMAIVVTESGREFTATPNHPMLTSGGWRSAGEIGECDDLICHVGDQDASSARDEDITDPPATIAEIFVTASTVGVVERRRGGEPDFHGDGREGEVDIARPDGVLTIGRLAALYEHLEEDVFAPSDVVDGPRFCANCGHLLAVDKSRCLCGTASGYAGVAEDATDETTGDAELAFDSLHGLACAEPFDDRFSVHVASEVGRPTAVLEEVGARHAEAAALDVALLEPIEDGGLVDPDVGGDLRRAHAGEVELDRVVSCRLVPFAGYVFNLITPHGYFTVNGGYTGNTELAAAVNGGSLAAAKIANQATGGAVATKTWMTASGATYPRHEDYEGLDGQTVGLDEMFDVGGNPFSFPGDPDGDPGDSINCRCAMSYSGDASGAMADNIDAAGEVSPAERQTQVLHAAHRRIDELEVKLAVVLQPILARAGEVAARRFEELATNHLTAADDPSNPAGWTPPAAAEILPINCEAIVDVLGVDGISESS